MAGKLVCWRCGESLGKVEQPFPRLAKCRSCEADLHVCRMCQYYNPKLNDRCDHELAEPAREVDVANFCHYLKLKPNAYVSIEHGKAKDAAEQLKSLFNNEVTNETDSDSPEQDKLDMLKDLFNSGNSTDKTK